MTADGYPKTGLMDDLNSGFENLNSTEDMMKQIEDGNR